MADINNVTLTGNLGQEPRLITTESGMDVCSMRVAVSVWSKAKQVTEARWFNVKAFGSTARFCSEYLKKGDKVTVSGRLDSREYDRIVKVDGTDLLDDRGQVVTVRQTATEIIANEVVSPARS